MLVSGTFNVLHPGHIYFLKKAKKLGGKNAQLIVVLTHRANTDKVVYPDDDRKMLISAVKFVDKVILGDKKDKSKVIKKEKPDIIVLGYDQKMPCNFNGKIYKIKKYKNYSSGFKRVR